MSRLLATPWTAAYQAPPSMGPSRQEYWSRVPLPSPFIYFRKLKLLTRETHLSLDWWISFSWFLCSRDVSVVFAFISLLVMLPTWWILSSWLVWGVILFVYLIIRALRLWRTAKLQVTLKKYSVYLEDIATDSRGFTNLVRKALRLIQETEVISRGFTLWVHFSFCFLNNYFLLPS